MAQRTTIDETKTDRANEQQGAEGRAESTGSLAGSGQSGGEAWDRTPGHYGRQGSSGGQQGRSAGTGLSRRGGYGLSPWSGGLWSDDPFTLMRQLADQMDRFFEDFGFGRGGSLSRALGGGAGRGLGQRAWAPQVEVRQRGNELVVCADLPGLKREDVQVEVRDDVLILQGERRHEHQDEQEGWLRSERSYGSFFRTIPLPEGTDPEQARASFRDGVLEVTVPLPRRETRGRRIEIGEGSPGAGASAGSGGQWGGQSVGSAESTASSQPSGQSPGGGSTTGEPGGTGRTSEGGL